VKSKKRKKVEEQKKGLSRSASGIRKRKIIQGRMKEKIVQPEINVSAFGGVKRNFKK